ncbi:tetratricopeptide repeat protein [Helicobacter pylori HP260AFi]|uniref:Tetratricopeptide repeat protein n=2 Tax=Helicobacter pylori TaxID=210 RepID=A0ABC9S9W0_HELPX|nr:tetratricopeptide repeat protein [Helicobacter pylori GAM260ASi]EMH30880.1 tetratricopeptide repeat protein [Helicobacter pylori GAM268Bii]EMH63617.1 tetratricopeptide repeat protein [Helicobacter pylori HP260AFi]EMH65780.1 tetratricopeptide repeat protein [Helicobacter pylori HP260ASii]EMH67221.1 tetratricopeptide repeat protein [Helicobacter pylori HP260AFii]
MGLLSHSLNALSLTLTQGKEGGEDFSVLTLRHNKAFSCFYTNEKPPSGIEASLSIIHAKRPIECVIDSIPKEGFTPLENAFFNITYSMHEQQFILHIKPKVMRRLTLFSFDRDYKKAIPLFVENDAKAKMWQIIGYDQKIPFLSEKDNAQKGLNFPIIIKDAQTPIIQELDVNNKPLLTTKGYDLNAYLEAKKQMDSQAYFDALRTISRAFKNYPQTIFKKDLYLLEIIALGKLGIKKSLLIDIGTQWIKNYPTDPNIPEALYYVAKALDENNNYKQAVRYYKRILLEYKNSRYAPLAQMHLAIEAAEASDLSSASMLFKGAFSNAKDKESASEIALNWAEAEINYQNFNNAKYLIDKVVQSNPDYLSMHSELALELLKLLKKNQMNESAIEIAQLLLNQDDDVKAKEQALYDLGALYARIKDFKNAHLYNLRYLQDHAELERASVVRARDEKALFSMEGNTQEKIAHYDKIIQNFPNSNEAQKALELKAQLLFDNKHYAEVLGMQKNLPKDSPLIQKTLNILAKTPLENNRCEEALKYLSQITAFEFSPKEEIQAFDCLYFASLKEKAQIIALNALKAAKTPIEKLVWLYRLGRNYYRLGDFKNSTLASKDALILAQSLNKKEFYDIAFVLFSDYMQNNERELALNLYAFLEKYFKDDKRMALVYFKLLENEKDPKSVKIYATSLLKLQDAYKDYSYTPFGEFALIDAYRVTKDYLKALEALDKLLNRRLSLEDHQKALYLQSSLLDLTNQKAKSKASLEKCVQLKQKDQTNAWQNLCEQGLNLFKNKES